MRENLSIFMPAQLERARQLFFEQCDEPEGLIQQPIWRSWQRCREQGHQANDRSEFSPVTQQSVQHLIEGNNALITAAAPELDRLAKVVSGAGYGVLLTDAKGVALGVRGTLERSNRVMQLALRPGVDLSERAIGTSAMSVAIAEQAPCRVFGGEHYFADNRLFHCVAAPIHDPSGQILGVIDLTRDATADSSSALRLVTECAKLIEQRLFHSLPAHLTLEFDWRDPGLGYPATSFVAFGEDGEIVGANRQARYMLNLGDFQQRHFDDVFDGRFSDLMSATCEEHLEIPLHLRSGFCFTARLVRREQSVARPGNPRKSPEPVFGDPAINRELHLTERAFKAGLPVLITGATGTGKEVVAQHLHTAGTRAQGPFIAINCAAIPETLIEAELFGYVGGAFTGALKNGAKGKIAAAEGGTLFLDEIGDMPLALQARLLRVLELHEVTPVGGLDTQSVDFQLICATHRHLPTVTQSGLFREDLLYRIRGVEMQLPPLCERADLPRFIEQVLHTVCGAETQISAEALAVLSAHDWPGNVRELRNCLQFAGAMAQHGVITAADLPSTLQPCPRLGQSSKREQGVHAGTAAQAVPQTGTIQAAEQAAIVRAMDESAGNVSAAARRLGVSRATLYRRLQLHSPSTTESG